ncbi:hypothetical protein DACRYDRAFT_104501 [Dacryopinax primogenitus]|uniref:SigF-like NTF2-like domain-containing protein n=1 Tax=Dacryopinax primogenitus (strain DJM 731) TaxID=1858805 RepID=M5GDL2_DACPD|nr:uncharacterized protein DACRYDRAFT_104501 [Dacryopinax primogenitus]EJU04617.1 hypothetical protein DACRYDRAFT_104501 [Dacryopinax primogenitus]
MEDPAKELPEVVMLFTMASTPEVQQAAINKYFSKDASFNHPLCKIEHGTESREGILAVYQWYRILSPKISVHVDNCHWDPKSGKAFVAVTQTFHLWFSPWPGKPAKLLVRLTLQDQNGKYYIVRQEDFYEPEELGYIVFPPLGYVIELGKYAGAAASILGVWGVQTASAFGWWKPEEHECTE